MIQRKIKPGCGESEESGEVLEEVTAELRPNGSEGASHAGLWGRSSRTR